VLENVPRRAPQNPSNREPLDEVAPGLLQQPIASHQVLAPAELLEHGVEDHRVVRVERREEVEAGREHRPRADGADLAGLIGGDVLRRERLERRDARGRVVVGRGLRGAEGLQRRDVFRALRAGPGGDRVRAVLDLVSGLGVGVCDDFIERKKKKK